MKIRKNNIISLICLISIFVCFTNIVLAQENTPQAVTAVSKPQSPAKAETIAKPAVVASQGDYVGAEKCGSCHPAEFKDFERRKFNKAWRILKMRGEEKNPECLKCHVTGFGRGGFVSEEKTPELVGKQCEACHGPGGNHFSNPTDAGFKKQLYIGDKKNVCLECHACMTTHKTTGF